MRSPPTLMTIEAAAEAQAEAQAADEPATEETEAEAAEAAASAEGAREGERRKPRRAAWRGLLVAWLKLWGKADAPRKLHGAAGLYAACETLVGHSDAQVRPLAIECLCKWQQPARSPHTRRSCSH